MNFTSLKKSQGQKKSLKWCSRDLLMFLFPAFFPFQESFPWKPPPVTTSSRMLTARKMRRRCRRSLARRPGHEGDMWGRLGKGVKRWTHWAAGGFLEMNFLKMYCIYCSCLVVVVVVCVCVCLNEFKRTYIVKVNRLLEEVWWPFWVVCEASVCFECIIAFTFLVWCKHRYIYWNIWETVYV